MEITTARLKEVLHYDPKTGAFTWRVKRRGHAGGVKPGDAAGQVLSVGYLFIGIDGKRYYAHRLAWKYMTGMTPTTIDHIDGDRLNNKFANLRDATRKTNNQNLRRAQRNNQSGLLGVQKNGSGWMARCETGGKQIYLGTFRTPQEAHEAYLTAKRAMHAGNTL